MSSARATFARLLPASLAITMAACEPREHIWLAPRSRADSLVFLFGPTAHGRPGGVVTYLEVMDCLTAPPQRQRRRTYWRVVPRIDARNDPPYIRYGTTPIGFDVTHAPVPLRFGCYEAWGGLFARMRFEVRADGSVREVPGYD